MSCFLFSKEDLISYAPTGDILLLQPCKVGREHPYIVISNIIVITQGGGSGLLSGLVFCQKGGGGQKLLFLV